MDCKITKALSYVAWCSYTTVKVKEYVCTYSVNSRSRGGRKKHKEGIIVRFSKNPSVSFYDCVLCHKRKLYKIERHSNGLSVRQSVF